MKHAPDDAPSLTYEDLDQSLRFALDRVSDRVKDSGYLEREDVGGFDVYAYPSGDLIARGVNNLVGVNIFRDKVRP